MSGHAGEDVEHGAHWTRDRVLVIVGHAIHLAGAMVCLWAVFGLQGWRVADRGWIVLAGAIVGGIGCGIWFGPYDRMKAKASNG